MTQRAFPKMAAAALAACGAGAIAAAVAPALAQGLPDGKAKELVRMACLDCHDLSPITGGGFSRAEWDTIVRTMVDMGANMKREDIPVVVDYLAASFPPRGKQ